MSTLAFILSLTAAVPTSSSAVQVTTDVEAPAVLDRFVGSDVTFTTAGSLQNFDPGQQLTFNPTVRSSLVATPRYDIGAGFSANARFGFSYDWTNSDFTRKKHEPLLIDTSLGASYTAPALPWGSRATAGVSLALPTSKISQARTMVIAPSLSLAVSHDFDVGPVDVRVLASGAYQHPFYEFTTPSLSVDPAYAPQCFGGDVGCVSQASGIANASDILSWSLFASAEWWIVSGGASLSMSHQFPFGFDDLGGVARVDDPSTIRVTSAFDVWASMKVVDGADLRVGYLFSRNVIEGDGTLGNLLYDRYQDGQLYAAIRLAPFDVVR